MLSRSAPRSRLQRLTQVSHLALYKGGFPASIRLSWQLKVRLFDNVAKSAGRRTSRRNFTFSA
jgi:hypothetical protein